MKVKDLFSAIRVLRKAKSAIIVTDSLTVTPVGVESFWDKTMRKLNDHIMQFHI